MSWVTNYDAAGDFTVHCLPYGVFTTSQDASPRIGVAIADSIIDCRMLAKAGILRAELGESDLNAFMALDKAAWTAERKTLVALVVTGGDARLQKMAEALVEAKHCIMHLPCRIGDYTDSYASREHASNVGSMFRDPENPLLPNWLHIPIAYHGRASSVTVDGSVRRPWGQTKLSPDQEAPEFMPSVRADFEMEMGFFVGGAENTLGTRLSMQQATDRLFGMVLLNDWSARDIQKWEYVPLGPFTGKNFGTSISPWVVPIEALAPFMVEGPDQSDVTPLPYLQHAAGAKTAPDVALTVTLRSEQMAAKDAEAQTVCQTNLKYMYWSMAQQLTHHSVTGCNMRAGDLLGTGTISGPAKGSYGSMLEISWGGKEPLTLEATGETRKFLSDNDEVVMSGHCASADGSVHIGFGTIAGKVLPAASE